MVRIDLKAADALTDAERAELRQLSRAVYPPEDAVQAPDPIVWAPQQWRIRVWDDTGRLVSHVGLLTRAVLHDGTPLRVGGVGGVQTHPEARGRGYASAAMARAHAFFRDEAAAPFALLVCPEERVSFYAGLGWQRFHGILNVEQPGGIVPFTHNEVMVCAVRSAAPAEGTLDLQGLPW